MSLTALRIIVLKYRNRQYQSSDCAHRHRRIVYSSIYSRLCSFPTDFKQTLIRLRCVKRYFKALFKASTSVVCSPRVAPTVGSLRIWRVGEDYLRQCQTWEVKQTSTLKRRTGKKKKKKPTSNEAGIHPPVSCEELTLRHHSDFDRAVLSEPRKTGKRYPSKQQQQQQQKSQQWNLTLCQVSGTKCLLLGRNLEISSEQSFFLCVCFLLLLFFFFFTSVQSQWDFSHGIS